MDLKFDFSVRSGVSTRAGTDDQIVDWARIEQITL